MSKFDNPIQFNQNQKVGNIEMTYSNLIEISQGGPLIGGLSLNGKIIIGRFGGPPIHLNEYIYIPVFTKKMLGSGFKLAKINTETLEMNYSKKVYDLIFLDRVDGNRIYFFEDLNRSSLKYYEF